VPPAGTPAPRRAAAALTASAWAPFGWLPVDDTDPADEHAPHLEFAWSDAHANVISHSFDEVAAGPGLLRCGELFRHDTHTQALLVLDVPAVVAVAERAATFERPEDATSIAVFRLEPLQVVVLHRGTWHWGPYPVSEGTVHLFNVQGWRYREDNTRVDLEAAGAAVDVDVGGCG
jgi:ureidoglycolate hydrolase